MSFFVFTGKLIRFWILQSDWVRLNLYIYDFHTFTIIYLSNLLDISDFIGRSEQSAKVTL